MFTSFPGLSFSSMYIKLSPSKRNKTRSNDVLEISSSTYSKVIYQLDEASTSVEDVVVCSLQSFYFFLYYIEIKSKLFRPCTFPLPLLLYSIFLYVTITQNHRPSSANVKRQRWKRNHFLIWYKILFNSTFFDYSEKLSAVWFAKKWQNDWVAIFNIFNPDQDSVSNK